MPDTTILTAEELASIRRPYRGARLLPGRAYHDEAIHDWVREHFLRHDWVIVGRESEAPEAGTFFTTELYLPSAIVDRDNREAWLRQGGKDTYGRACDEVDRRLAAYRPIETDPAIEAELRAIIRAGLTDQTVLPDIPPAPEPMEEIPSGAAARRRNPRRHPTESATG